MARRPETPPNFNEANNLDYQMASPEERWLACFKGDPASDYISSPRIRYDMIFGNEDEEEDAGFGDLPQTIAQGAITIIGDGRQRPMIAEDQDLTHRAA